jgi:hypothetical protein
MDSIKASSSLSRLEADVIFRGFVKAGLVAFIVLLLSGGVTWYFWSLYNASLKAEERTVYLNKTETIIFHIIRKVAENEQILRGQQGQVAISKKRI